MSDAKLRHAIAFEAARLMYERVESEYFTAKRKAAKRLCRGSLKPEDLPSNALNSYLRAIEAGTLNVVVASVYRGLDKVGAAHHDLEYRHRPGKCVVVASTA